MNILVVGDVHMEFGALNMLINKKKPDMILACGDFGYWPNVSWGLPLSNIKLQDTKKILWCDGNHEDHWALRDRTTDELAPNIIYMPRGSTYTLPDGRTILFMGGAHSIDKYRRTEGIDWFREEVITQSDLENLPDPNTTKIDIFITHTCPTELVEMLMLKYPEKGMEPSNHALSTLWDMYNPKLWFFGHWHQYMSTLEKDSNTQFYCLSAPGLGGQWWMWLPEKT